MHHYMSYTSSIHISNIHVQISFMCVLQCYMINNISAANNNTNHPYPPSLDPQCSILQVLLQRPHELRLEITWKGYQCTSFYIWKRGGFGGGSWFLENFPQIWEHLLKRWGEPPFCDSEILVGDKFKEMGLKFIGCALNPIASSKVNELDFRRSGQWWAIKEEIYHWMVQQKSSNISPLSSMMFHRGSNRKQFCRFIKTWWLLFSSPSEIGVNSESGGSTPAVGWTSTRFPEPHCCI